MLFLRDPQAYRAIATATHAVFDTQQRLTEMVFRRPGVGTAFFEFEELFHPPFCALLRHLARHYRDEEILCTAIQPSAETYFYPLTGYYATMRLPADFTDDEYRRTIAYEPPPPAQTSDSLLILGEVLVYFVPSGGFAIWAERDPELSVLALYDATAARAPTVLPPMISWLTVDEAIEQIGMGWTPRPVPDRLTIPLRHYYGPTDMVTGRR